MRKHADIKSLDYVDRVNRAIDLIHGKLDQPLNLEVVARAACFSPFHFHRIFRSLTGEPLNEFVKRLRLERALSLIWQKNWTARRQLSFTDIALTCGFGSSSDFARCFKRRFGVAASRLDVAAFRARRRKALLKAVVNPKRRHLVDRVHPGWNRDGFEVRLRQLPPRSVAYIRVQEPFREGASLNAATRLAEWAERHGLADGQWLAYMWDHPDITAYQKCRYDIGLVVPSQTPRGEVSRIEFPAMQVAEIEIRGGIDLEVRALDWLFETWLPSSGFVPSDQPSFEACIGRPFAHGNDYFEYTHQLPVVRADRIGSGPS